MVAVVAVVVLALRVALGCGRYKDERDRFFPLVQHKYGLLCPLLGGFSAVAAVAVAVAVAAVALAVVERTGNLQNPLKNLERCEDGDAVLVRLGSDLGEEGCCLLRGRTSSSRSETVAMPGTGTGTGTGARSRV